MGCFNVSCAVSHITINEGERVFLFPLLPNISDFEIKRGHPDDGSVIISPRSMFLETTELYNPFCFPIEGIYDDYGSLEDIVENENTRLIENFLGISIQEFVELVTENRGNNVYDSCSVYYEKFFHRKDLMKGNVSFIDFLIGIGFEHRENSYRYPGSNYSVSIVNTEGKEEYILVPDAEAEIRMKKYLTYITSGQLKLPDGYRLKYELLELHQFMIGKAIGTKQCRTMKIVQKLSAMFVHGDIYDKMTTPAYKLGMNPEKIKISEYLLYQLGFNKNGENYLKDSILVKYNNFTTTMSKGNISIMAHDCKEFKDAYKKLSGFECDMCDMEDYDNEMFLFKDVQIRYRNSKLFLDALNAEKSKVFYGDTDETNRSYWLKEMYGMITFRDWPYFITMYLGSIDDGSIESVYVKYMRFHCKMHQINASFMPTYQGVQCGCPEAEKELLETAIKIVNKKLKQKV